MRRILLSKTLHRRILKVLQEGTLRVDTDALARMVSTYCKTTADIFAESKPRVGEREIRVSELSSDPLFIWAKSFHPELCIKRPPPFSLGLSFYMGYCVEAAVTELLMQEFPNLKTQRTVTGEYNGWKVIGHYDYVINDCIIDCKALSKWSYERFLDSQDHNGYWLSLTTYAHLAGVNSPSWLIYLKQETLKKSWKIVPIEKDPNFKVDVYLDALTTELNVPQTLDEAIDYFGIPYPDKFMGKERIPFDIEGTALAEMLYPELIDK